jgi:predicted enzyme related to lactoylglutathione lyase
VKRNSVVHFEIYANDPDGLSRFYSTLFDWSIESMPAMDYGWIKTVETDAKGTPTQPGSINGGILKRPQGYNGPAWVNYVNVESIEASIDRAEELGGRLMKGKTAVPGMGWFAFLNDPQGNVFAIWQSDANAK